MTYEKLIAGVSQQAELDAETIRKVLVILPDTLLTLKRGEQVRTPLGTFRMTRRAARKVLPIEGTEPFEVPAEMVVKLKAGNKLRKDPPN